MESQTVKEILKRFPEAVSALFGVRVGDVVVMDVDQPLVVINETTCALFNSEDSIVLQRYFIIGNADKVAG